MTFRSHSALTLDEIRAWVHVSRAWQRYDQYWGLLPDHVFVLANRAWLAYHAANRSWEDWFMSPIATTVNVCSSVRLRDCRDLLWGALRDP